MHSDGTRIVTLTLHRDPRLFKIVQTYPAGYCVLPLADDWMPAYMSHEAALNNPPEDARFYTLRTLIGPLAPAVDGAGVRRAMALNDEEGEWQIVYVSPTTGARRRSGGPFLGQLPRACLLIRAVVHSTRHESAG